MVQGGRFGALAHRDYRLLFLGQGISATGGWMQIVAQGWLIYTLTGSSAALGLVGLARAAPAFLFSLMGGAIADRYDRRMIMLVANGVVAGLSFVLAILTWTETVAVWHLVVIALLSGTAFSFEMPSRQSLVADVVGPKDMVNAIGLNSVAFNVASVLGPALAAVLIERIGEASVFFLNGLSFLTVVLGAALMRPVRRALPSRGSLLMNMLDGLRYVRRTPALLMLLLVNGAVSLLVRPYLHLLPVYARDILQVGASGLGALNSLSGVGAVVAAMLVAALGSYPRRGLAVMASGIALGGALVVFALSTSYSVALVAAAALGFLSSYAGINTNSMLQVHSDPRMCGRVVSLHALSMMGAIPLGVMLEGTLGSLIGVPTVLAIGGVASLLVALAALLLVPRVRNLA